MITNCIPSHHSQSAISARMRMASYQSRANTPADVPVESLDDETLARRCQMELPHRTDAYNEIVRRFRPLIMDRAYRMLSVRSDAEEVCQDVFVQVFRKIHQFEGRSTLKTWLFRIVFNMCMTYRRKLATRREKQNEFAEQVNISASADAADIGIDDLCDTVQKALTKLDKDKREIVSLRFVAGLTLKEIADKSNLKLSATKMRLYRALGEFEVAYSEASKKSAA